MPPSSPVGQATVKSGPAEGPAGHGLGPEPVPLAQDDAGEGHRERRADDEHAAHVAHQRRLLRLGPHHEAGRVAQRQHRQPERLAQLQEAGGLVGVSRRRSRRPGAAGCWR